MNSTFPYRTWVVNRQNPAAHDSNPGTEEKPLRSIMAAAKHACPGDTVLVHAGTYRETVVPARSGEEDCPITYQAAHGERVVIKGSEVVTGKWHQRASSQIFATSIPVMDGAPNPFSVQLIEKGQSYIHTMREAATHRTLGQVFLDGLPLDEVDRPEHLESMPGTWLPTENGTRLLVHFPAWVIDPADHIVEITLRSAVFRPESRGLGYLVIRGFVMEHASNQALTSFWEKGSAPQQGLISCRSGHHWLIENNVIRYAKSIGLDVGSEGRMDELDGQATPGLVGYHRIIGNTISDNGQGGICGLGHIGTEIIDNILERNNTLGATAWEEAAIKTHFYVHGRIEGNLIRGNFCNGIWLDNVYQDVRVTRNVILNNQGAGIFCEMGGGPCLIDNNVIGLQTPGNPEIGGNGIYAHDAGGVTVVHNLFCQNARYGIFIQIAGERNYTVYPDNMASFTEPALGEKPCHCSNVAIQNNVFVENLRGALNLPYPAEKASNLSCDFNLYSDEGEAGLFAVNDTAGARQAELLAALPAGSPTLNLGKHLLLPFAGWKILMGMDSQSSTCLFYNVSWQVLHPGPGAWLTYHIEPSGLVDCPVIPEVACDFYGNPMPTSQPAPGPFQVVQQPGPYHFRLWPNGKSHATIKSPSE